MTSHHAEMSSRIVPAEMDFGRDDPKPTHGLDWSSQNQNGLLVMCQIDNFSPGAVTGGKLALTRDKNFDTRSSDNSVEEIRESGRTIQSLVA